MAARSAQLATDILEFMDIDFMEGSPFSMAAIVAVETGESRH
jgi:hypothetical protein